MAVTPNTAVSPDPRAEPAKEPPLRMDISVANNVASTPCVQISHDDWAPAYVAVVTEHLVSTVARNAQKGCPNAQLLYHS